MASVTLTTLRARARERADMVNSTFITDAATSLDALINEGVQELHELLIEHYGENYSVSSSSTSTVAGTSTYALPSDFFKLLGVDLALSSTDTYDLKRFNWKERNVFKGASQWGALTLPQYSLEGSNLRVYPAPAGVYTLTIWYVPMLALLANGSDTVNFPNGWERYVVLAAAIKALKKEESNTQDLERELNILKADIIARAENRDTGAPNQAVDQEAIDETVFWGGYVP